MKRLILFVLASNLLTACYTDYYENDYRIIVEGNVINNNKPLQNAEVKVVPVSNVNVVTNNISELKPDSNYGSEGYVISQLKTTDTGKISFSLPRHERTNTYIIKISKGAVTKTYGYISENNIRNYYVNLGTLIF